jgi:adenosylhomocysteine nucleosidase
MGTVECETVVVTAVILISCGIEWEAIVRLLPGADLQISPFGHWFSRSIKVSGREIFAIFFQGGWGKISAAASAQYVIDRWKPSLLVNLGTCGGFEGCIERGDIILVERAVVYDILEQRTDPEAAISFYTTDLDMSWLADHPPMTVRRTVMVSADRDLIPGEVRSLKAKYGAVAGDWESGSIAWVAARNGVRCLILRGVSDIVGEQGGEIYAGNVEAFREGTKRVMKTLTEELPDWIEVGLD